MHAAVSTQRVGDTVLRASDEPIERHGQVDHDLGHGNPLSSAILDDPIRVRVL
jgi:hypothetical protein